MQVRPVPASATGSTFAVPDQADPLKAATFPLGSATAQKCVLVHETDCGVPAVSMTCPADQLIPLNVYSWPPASVATQKVVVGQEIAFAVT